MLKSVYLLVFLSGLTGLVYQVTWQKYLSVMLGSHAQAAALVLALFFLFLSLGYEFFGRISYKLSKDRLVQYAGIEVVIGVYALYSPNIFQFLFESYSLSSGSLFVSIIYSALFLGLPTFLMGGTIPVLTQGLSTSFEASSKTHSLIYAINTLGAFIGVVLGGFYFIESFGLAGTLTITGDANIAIGLLALFIAHKNKYNFLGPVALTSEYISAKSERKIGPLLYAISFFSGFYVFTLEKLIIRLAGLSSGSSVYAYSIIVAAFVLAIGLGSYLLSLRKTPISKNLVVQVLVATFISVLMTYLLVDQWPSALLRIRLLFQSAEMNFSPYWLVVLGFYLLVLLVPVGLMGANLPMLFGVIKQKNKDLASSVGRLYAVNCMGSALGAIFGGYLAFIYFEGFQVFKMVLLLIALSGTLAIFVLYRESNKKYYAAFYILICALSVVLLPSWNPKSFTPGKHLITNAPESGEFSSLFKTNKKNDIIYERFDPNTYVTVTEISGGNKGLYVNGKPDAITNGDNNTRAMAAITPITIHSQKVQNVFIVGLGAGLSTAVAASFNEVQKVKVAEISSGVVGALPYFEDFNLNLKNQMDKLELVVGDGYKVLLSDPSQYDLIICEPSNPWVAGIEKLYSKEFYDVVSTKIGEDGLFAQWFPMFTTDPDTVLSIFKTFALSFKHVAVWSAHGGALTLIGSKKPISPNLELMNDRFEGQKSVYEKFNISDPKSLFALQLLTDFEFRSLLDADGRINSVYEPMLEFRAGRSFFAGIRSGLDPILLKKLPLPIPENVNPSKKLFKTYQLDPNNYLNLEKVLSNHFLSVLDLLLYFWEQDPRSKLLKDKYKNLDDYLFLLGETKANSKSATQYVVNDLQVLALKLRQLNAIGRQPKLSRLDQVIQSNKSAKDYSKSLFSALSYLAAPEAFSKMAESLEDSTEPTKNDVKTMEALYAEVVSTYKSLGAY